jgi:cytochrome c
MKRLTTLTLVVGGIIVGSLAGYTPSVAQLTWSVLEAEEAAGKQVFGDHCAVCHDGILGPTLNGIVGRPAASVAGFGYSKALKKSGITWTEDNLRKWITDTDYVVRYTQMPHISIKDPAEQIYLIAYLKTLKGPTTP